MGTTIRTMRLDHWPDERLRTNNQSFPQSGKGTTRQISVRTKFAVNRQGAGRRDFAFGNLSSFFQTISSSALSCSTLFRGQVFRVYASRLCFYCDAQTDSTLRDYFQKVTEGQKQWFKEALLFHMHGEGTWVLAHIV